MIVKSLARFQDSFADVTFKGRVVLARAKRVSVRIFSDMCVNRLTCGSLKENKMRRSLNDACKERSIIFMCTLTHVGTINAKYTPKMPIEKHSDDASNECKETKKLVFYDMIVQT